MFKFLRKSKVKTMAKKSTQPTPQTVPAPKKRGRPPGTKNKPKEPVVAPPVAPTPPAQTVAVTQAIKHYIWENFGKMSMEELAKNTGLSASEVERVATSSELDKEPVVDDKTGVSNLRRFATKKGTVMMTSAQSMMDDVNYIKNVPNAAENNSRIPGVSTIERREVL